MDLLQTIETQKTELGAVTPITETSTENENDQVSVQGMQEIEVSPAEVYSAIGDVLERVWLVLSDNLQTDLSTEQVSEWVDTLQWAIEVMPPGYERQREIIKAELDKWQFFL